MKIKKWLFTKPSNNVLFMLLFIQFVGVWFTPMFMLYSLPIAVGVSGVNLTDTQIHNLSETVTNTFIPPLRQLNNIGLEHSGKFSGYVIRMIIYSLPYITLTWMIIISINFIRLLLYGSFKVYMRFKK